MHGVEADGSSAWLRGLSWIERHRDHFALGPGPADPDNLFPIKMLAELARIADVLARSRALPPEARERVGALLRFAWEQFGEGRVFAELLKARPYVVLGTLYSIFERHGFTHAETRALLAALASPGGVSAAQIPRRPPLESSDLAPYGRDGVAVLALGLALAWRQMGLPSPWSEDRFFPLTWLSRRPEKASLSEPEAYSLTHVVFFMTDFGDRPESLSGEFRAYLRGRCPAWMESFRRSSNLDLYAELATVLSCVAEPVPAEVEGVLRQALTDDGMLPGPGLRSWLRLSGVQDPERRRFLENYHTTLAGVLASFAATQGLARGHRDAPRGSARG